MCALLLLAWQCLAPGQRHVLFNNVGIFYCFAFITVEETKAENRNRKPVALKPELYGPTTVRCNMSIWIQRGRVFEQDVCLMRRYSFFFSPLLSQNVCSLSCVSAGSLQLHQWPPIAARDHARSGVQRFRLQSQKPQGSISAAGMKSTAQARGGTGTQREGRVRKGEEGKFISVLLLLGQSAGPCIKQTTAYEMSP